MSFPSIVATARSVRSRAAWSDAQDAARSAFGVGTKRSGATNGVASVQSNGSNPARYELRDAADGRTFFVLKASNGQNIARGELYASRSNAQRGIDTCVALLSTQIARQ